MSERGEEERGKGFEGNISEHSRGNELDKQRES